MVARDSSGVVLFSAAGREFHMRDVKIAEAMAIRWAMRIAIDLGFKEVMFETDNLSVVKVWSSFSSQLSYLASILSDCVVLSSSFNSCSLSHVRRSGNMAADFMAKFALSDQCFVWISDAPPGIEGILSNDVLSASI
ncbi:uncharacterized protein LOC130744175 [Lotus japonicus]|uniref:uncharacterized protein LOC130744175 n=1 Tax=Lotus japonicus TaxID=34305 RepID=UPI0025854E4C|nr:uncharacterized protein LOC130744175 [Lotus japonicus]